MRKLLICLFMFLVLPLTALGADLQTLNDQQLNALLDKNKGKVVMINFFATWCPPCRAEMPEIVKLRNAYPDSKLTIIALSVDEDASLVPPFIEKAGVNFPVYMAARDITNRFGISSIPHMAFFGKDGKLKISEPGRAEMSVLKEVVDDLLASH